MSDRWLGIIQMGGVVGMMVAGSVGAFVLHIGRRGVPVRIAYVAFIAAMAIGSITAGTIRNNRHAA